MFEHFSIAYPFDSTTGRPFLDFPATKPEAELRDLMTEAIALFIDAHISHQAIALDALHQLLASSNSLIASFERK